MIYELNQIKNNRHLILQFSCLCIEKTPSKVLCIDTGPQASEYAADESLYFSKQLYIEVLLFYDDVEST